MKTTTLTNFSELQTFLQRILDRVASLESSVENLEKQVVALDQEVQTIGDVVFEPTGELDS